MSPPILRLEVWSDYANIFFYGAIPSTWNSFVNNFIKDVSNLFKVLTNLNIGTVASLDTLAVLPFKKRRILTSTNTFPLSFCRKLY